ncbi:MAG: hypothetical protein EBT80_01410 [Chitinophagales bacterium]|jgi:hypothetical protein|nr:hypothetical protein [Chitinophagales bacterium]
MQQDIRPDQMMEIGNLFYDFVENRIEDLEKNYLNEMPELPFVHYCFHFFIEHYQQVYNTTHNKN